MIIQKLEFRETCSSCPEQYDVFKGGRQVGYVRLRWGTVTCDYPNCCGDTIYSHSFNDGWKGSFSDSTEREKYLDEIATMLNARIQLEYARSKQ